ncbi:bifunctional methylenetetrahydrofolate dehydrogenase/methenyltetrahydrofolate cyclohydrolase [Candidatus Peregrinibacteria bacterium CG10_big_fil_rev_8_21_14_0_10_36_19]|nr:MAG: bifunctional methylenetetrahydrofolate dehydrogenase/methenyltetrahydrofolate cyclohydrolase [Candidatus Peregrinibacteria bacterium CG10_big_fil_rev_8_21_14_0_10_36_19]
MEILDGRKVSKEILLELAGEVDLLVQNGIEPKLAVILVGNNPASLSYIRQKQKSCNAIGVQWEQFDYGEDVTTEELIKRVEQLNDDDSVHGILVQLPLPAHVYTPDVIRAIDPKKDVDGFTAYNLGKMFLSKDFEDLASCTPLGVIRLLERYNIDVKGKEVVVVGHSNIVGKPLAAMLLNRDATVTVCHVHTKDLASHTKRADILCVAVGKVNLITEDMVKDGVVVVDIGINRLENGNLVGDTDFEGVSKKASYITPVPGGAGPMTVTCLMENTVRAAKRLNNIT